MDGSRSPNSDLSMIPLKRAYSSDFDNILADFYIPVLRASIQYRRLAGFFSSTSLSASARGITGLIRNGGAMQIIVSPMLSAEDVNTIILSREQPEIYLGRIMLKELQTLEDAFVKDHLYALGWMLANKRLEIKVAIPVDNAGLPLSSDAVEETALFHIKVGILRDGKDNILSFSGSVNETFRGWLENIEEFKVFRNWDPTEHEYVTADVQKFERFWNQQSDKVIVLEAPEAVKKHLISIAPTDISTIDLLKWYETTKKPELFDYQKRAVENWANNGMAGIFEMATGTGKTFTALASAERVLRTVDELIVVIACPYKHLLTQWVREIKSYGLSFDKIIIADSSNSSWKDNLADSLIDLSLGYKRKVVVLTTHRTFSTDEFTKLLLPHKHTNVMLIADEVHGLGATKAQKGLTNEYTFRLGLSATPKRWFDEPGTEALYAFFKDVVFDFPLATAITEINPRTGQTYLTPYRYEPRFASLNDDELQEYQATTRAILRRLTDKNRSSDEERRLLETLFFKRAGIIKNAVEKYDILEQILNEIGPTIARTIIYCSHKQIDQAVGIVSRRRISVHRFTMKEGTNRENRFNGLSERDFLLSKFAEIRYKVLVAMKCLDEGVDVPAARTAVLMASSGNPREYIQRIGRVIRRYPAKEMAVIYDIVVVPSFEKMPRDLREVEWKVFKKEIQRYEEIARIATNNAEALERIYDIKNRFLGGGIDAW